MLFIILTFSMPTVATKFYVNPAMIEALTSTVNGKCQVMISGNETLVTESCEKVLSMIPKNSR